MAGALKRGLAALVLCLVAGLGPVLGLSGCERIAPAAGRPAPIAAASGRGLQEVAPSAAVLQLRAALDRHQPRVRIQSPSDGTLLPPGPWTLEVDVRDWPLVDAGALGLGPHLVVQIDDQAPIRTTTAAASSGDAESRTVRLSLDPLSPGSHRITAYAARPWGEAVKDPGASAQITVHRVIPTPLTQPRRGEPQLRPVSPPTVAASEPVLIDWLLRDAPLQHLRDDDTQWRLRITVNGDSFQVDRQLPLWLKGFHPGSNAVVLELLDGLGEPIAPTLNTLVQEVIVQPGEGPVWNGNALTPELLATLLGERPAGSATAATGNPSSRSESRQEPGDRNQAEPADDDNSLAGPRAIDENAGREGRANKRGSTGREDRAGKEGRAEMNTSAGRKGSASGQGGASEGGASSQGSGSEGDASSEAGGSQGGASQGGASSEARGNVDADSGGGSAAVVNNDTPLDRGESDQAAAGGAGTPPALLNQAGTAVPPGAGLGDSAADRETPDQDTAGSPETPGTAIAPGLMPAANATASGAQAREDGEPPSDRPPVANPDPLPPAPVDPGSGTAGEGGPARVAGMAEDPPMTALRDASPDPEPGPPLATERLPAATPSREPAADHLPPVLPSARSELNADGSLIRPKKPGLFSGLRGGAS